MGLISSHPRVSRLAVLLVASAPVILSVALVPMTRDFTWDEAVYFGRAAMPEHWQALWADHRSLGIPIALWPAASLADSAVVVRIWFALASVAMGYACIRLWVPVLGRAVLFWYLSLCSAWPFVWYSTEIYPNWPVAVLFAGLAGWSARAMAGIKAPLLLGVTLSFAAFMVRHTDAVIMLAGLLLAVLALEMRRSGPKSGVKSVLRSHWPILAGYMAGGVIFLIESTVYFGGAISRLRAISRVSQVRAPLDQYVTTLLSTTPSSSVLGFRLAVLSVFLVLLGAIVIGGLVVAGERERRALLPALLAGVAIGALYFSRPGDYNSIARFLLPPFVLASIAGAPAWRAMMVRCGGMSWRLGSTAVARVSVVMILLAVLNLQVVNLRSSKVGTRDIPRKVAAVINELAGSNDCAFGARYALPQVQIHTTCLGERVLFDRDTSEPTPTLLEADSAFLVGPNPPTGSWVDAGWSEVKRVDDLWVVWRREKQSNSD